MKRDGKGGGKYCKSSRGATESISSNFEGDKDETYSPCEYIFLLQEAEEAAAMEEVRANEEEGGGGDQPPPPPPDDGGEGFEVFVQGSRNFDENKERLSVFSEEPEEMFDEDEEDDVDYGGKDKARHRRVSKNKGVLFWGCKKATRTFSSAKEKKKRDKNEYCLLTH